MQLTTTLSPRRVRATAALAGAAALATAAALPAAASPTVRAGQEANPACSTSRLVVWLNTTGDGAAGSFYYKLELTNLSTHACTLHGYPGVSGLSLAGHQLGSPAARSNTHPAATVTLAAGASATAVLRIVEAGNFPAATCRQVTAAGLRVFPPNQTAPKVVPFPFHACSHAGPAYLTVEAVT